MTMSHHPTTPDFIEENGPTCSPDVFAIVRSAHDQMMRFLTAGPPERGLFGVARADGIVRHMYADCTAACSRVTYSPNVDVLNRVLSEQFGPEHIQVWPHSHPGVFGELSTGDLEYAAEILQANPQMPYLYIPIVTLVPTPTLHPHVVERGQTGGVISRRLPLRIYHEALTPADAPIAAAPVPLWRRITSRLPGQRPWWDGEAFERVRDAYDLELLAHSRALVIGCGAGGMRLAIDLHRLGLGSSALIDPDRVSRQNLTTQPVTRGDIGEAKTEVLRRHVRAIHGRAAVRTITRCVEEVSDRELQRLTGSQDKTPPRRLLVIGTTDSFAAQAHAARLALRFGAAYLGMQLYAHGEGGEVVFVHPEVTPACARCALVERYDAYAHGYQNTVTADGSPLSSTAAVSALAVRIVLMLLHHGSEHPRWDGQLQSVARCNLVQLRLDPRFDPPHVGAALHGRPEAYCGEPLWLPVDPVPGCPDCGGAGNLSARR